MKTERLKTIGYFVAGGLFISYSIFLMYGAFRALNALINFLG